MSRRGRALAFGLLAAICAVASASIAAGYRDSVDQQLGELREVTVLTAPLRAGMKLSRRALRGATEARSVPVRFLPPDVLTDPMAARGRRLAASVPAGSYLLASHLRQPSAGAGSGPTLQRGRHPVDILVAGAGSVAARGGGVTFVDVVVAAEPITGGRSRVEVAAEGVQLLGLEPADPAAAAESGGDAWMATLALERGQALELIEAENFARQIRIIPAGGGG